MNLAPALTFTWTGEAMEPLPGLAAAADGIYVIGQNYRLIEEEGRSEVSHKHEFAWLRTAWKNLPHTLAHSFPTTEHLRKRALIEAGYFREQIVDVGTNAAALRVASTFRARDEFLLVLVEGPIVVIREAKSQNHRSMGKREFQESKTAIMEIVANLIGVTPQQLDRERV